MTIHIYILYYFLHWNISTSETCKKVRKSTFTSQNDSTKGSVEHSTTYFYYTSVRENQIYLVFFYIMYIEFFFHLHSSSVHHHQIRCWERLKSIIWRDLTSYRKHTKWPSEMKLKIHGFFLWSKQFILVIKCEQSYSTMPNTYKYAMSLTNVIEITDFFQNNFKIICLLWEYWNWCSNNLFTNMINLCTCTMYGPLGYLTCSFLRSFWAMWTV